MSPLATQRIAQTPRWARDELWRRARAVPSLDLRFADNKSLVDATTGQNLIDFTRASGGTYVDSQGVIRTATTNLLLRSEEFDNASWAKLRVNAFGSGSIANAITSPDGNVTADYIQEDTTATNTHGVRQSYTFTAASHTVTLFVKAAERKRIRVVAYDGTTVFAAYFSTITGLPDNVGAGVTASMQPFLNGWYRCVMTMTTAVGSGYVEIRLAPDSGSEFYTGDGTSGIYLWGAQLEQSSTVGEYIPTTSTINSAPRFDHDPSTGESLGLLLEESRSNLLLQSEEFNNVSWAVTRINPFGSGSVANAIASPDLLVSADYIQEDTSASTSHFISQAYTFGAATYTLSVFAKAKERSELRLIAFDGASTFATYFDLATGLPGGSTDATSSSMQPFPNGWYRCVITFVAAAGIGYARIGLAVNGNQAYSGDGTSGLYLWGAQIEAGAFPTSYVKTEAATATRAADVASITGTNFSSWYNASAGTIYSDHLSNAVPGITFVGQLGDSTANYYDVARYQTVLRVYATSGGSIQVALNTALTTGSRHKTAFALQQNDFAFTADGLTPTADTSGAMPLVVTKLSIGNDLIPTTGREMNGTIKRLTFWPQRLSDAVLQSITR